MSRRTKSSFHNNNFVRKLIALLKSLKLIAWLVPSFTPAASSVSLIGIIFGPIMFPINYDIAIVIHVARVLLPHIVNGTEGRMSEELRLSALLPF